MYESSKDTNNWTFDRYVDAVFLLETGKTLTGKNPDTQLLIDINVLADHDEWLDKELTEEELKSIKNLDPYAYYVEW